LLIGIEIISQKSGLNRGDKMKIVFVQPNVGFKGHTWEALGIGYLSSYLKKYYDGDLEIEFYSGFYDSDEVIVNACRDANVIGFSCTSPQFKHGVQLAQQIKKDDNWIIFGGVHPSALPQDVLEEDCVDVVVKGEGERALLQVILDINNSKNISKRIYQSDFIINIDDIPFPDRVVIKNERNISQAYKDNGVRIASILSSRGCPYQCSFCSSREVWQQKVRHRSVDNILDECEDLIKNWGIQFIKFSDDTFTLNKKRLVDFCKAKIQRGIETPYGANAHINTIDENVIKNLAESNCQELWYGVESGSPQILKDIHKNTKISRIKEVFKITKDYGIKARAYFLLGMPNETLDDIKMTEKLCDEIQPDIVGFTLLAPYPKNEFFDYDTMRYWDWSTFDEYNNDWVCTKSLTNQQLKFEQNRLIQKYAKEITFRQKDV